MCDTVKPILNSTHLWMIYMNLCIRSVAGNDRWFPIFCMRMFIIGWLARLAEYVSALCRYITRPDVKNSNNETWVTACHCCIDFAHASKTVCSCGNRTPVHRSWNATIYSLYHMLWSVVVAEEVTCTRGAVVNTRWPTLWCGVRLPHGAGRQNMPRWHGSILGPWFESRSVQKSNIASLGPWDQGEKGTKGNAFGLARPFPGWTRRGLE